MLYAHRVSAEGWIALAGILATVIVAIAAHVKDFLVRRQDIAAQERERQHEAYEWGRRFLYERRLNALHEAYSWMIKFNETLNVPSVDEDELSKIQREAQEWLRLNVFYIYDGIPYGQVLLGAFRANTARHFLEVSSMVFDYLQRRAEWLGVDKMPGKNP